MLQHVYISRTGDREKIQEFLNDLKQLSDDELKAREQKAKSQGIFGVHAQGLYLIALHLETKKRFNDSVILIEDHCIISFKEN